MATFRKKDDPMVSCPYNPAHRMLRSRLQMHITKCVKDHPDADKETCPYNAKHRIRKAEMAHHIVTCEDRGLVEKKIAFMSSDINRGNVQVPSYAHELPPPSEETYWDEEAEIDPYQHQPKSNSLYKDPMILSTWKPAQRRNHYRSLAMRDSDEEAQPDEPPPPVQPVIRKKKLKELRQPKEDDLWAASGTSGLGRGCPSRRIAANIYGQVSPEPSHYPVNFLSGGRVNLGRGRGIFGGVRSEVVDASEYASMASRNVYGASDYPAMTAGNGIDSSDYPSMGARNDVGASDYPPIPPGQVSNIS